MLYPPCFERWAPPANRWSAWAKPVLFATGRPSNEPAVAPPPLADPAALPAPDGRTALILDLPATTCVAYALAAARRGYQPVPLFNTTPGVPNPSLNLQPLINALARTSEELAAIALPAGAPPAFMLDDNRLGFDRGRYNTPNPGDYDNRWILFPQDIPSGRLLRAHGITRVVVVRANSQSVLYDLTYLLRAWHRDGLAIDVLCLNGAHLTIRLKSNLFERIGGWFELLFAGLHRNSAGGFGSRVPFPSSGG